MKLNLGCGEIHIDGFVNIDCRYQPGVDSVEDIRFLRKYSDVDVIYACQVLEHFSRWEVHTILQRWYDVLKPGGFLYLSVPDFESIVDHYVLSNDMESVMGLLYGGQDYEGNFHHYAWSELSLGYDMKQLGLVNVRRYQWQDGPTADIDDGSKMYLPHMDQSGLLMSLNMVGEKSNG